jgi:hypothetical protein
MQMPLLSTLLQKQRFLESAMHAASLVYFLEQISERSSAMRYDLQES